MAKKGIQPPVKTPEVPRKGSVPNKKQIPTPPKRGSSNSR